MLDLQCVSPRGVLDNFREADERGCGTLRCVEIGLGTVFCAAKRTRMRYGWLHYVERVLLAMLVFSFGT